MEEVAVELAETLEEQPVDDFVDIVGESQDVDHALIIEEINNFAIHTPHVNSSEHLQHGLVLPTIFAAIAVIQFLLACVVFASLIYFIVRDYIELQQRRRLHAGLMRVLPGDELGDNNANDDDDEDRRADGLPAAAPEGTPPSQFPGGIVRRRNPAAPAGPPMPPPPPPPPPSAGALSPVAVVQVSSQPVTLAVVDRSVAAAAATAASTATTADGGSLDDGPDIIGRLQGAGGTGAKPKKIRYARKYQSHRPRTTTGNNDDTSSPTVTNAVEDVTTTTTTNSDQQHSADLSSTLNSAVGDDHHLSVLDDRDSTADQSEAMAEDQTTYVVPHRTHRSAWTTTAAAADDDDDPVMKPPTRRAGLFDHATTTAAAAFTKLSTAQTIDTDSDHRQRQYLFQQPSDVICENGVCRLVTATSIERYQQARTLTSYPTAPTAAVDLRSTAVRDAKSESAAKNRETTQFDMVPATLDVQSTTGTHKFFDSSSALRRVDVTVQPVYQHTSAASPAVGSGPDTAQHPARSDHPLGAPVEESGSVDAMPARDVADLIASVSSAPRRDNVSQTPTTSSDVEPRADHEGGTARVAALTAAAETPAVGIPLITVTTVSNQLLADDHEKHNSAATTL